MGRLEMTAEELDGFLTSERVIRIATVGDDGWPAVTPLWFVWHDGDFWVWTLTRAKRTRRFEQGTKVAYAVDAGIEYAQLQGVSGRCDHRFVADEEVPLEVRVGFSAKYFHTDHPLEPQPHHRWIRLTPLTVNSWDFRKLPT